MNEELLEARLRHLERGLAHTRRELERVAKLVREMREADKIAAAVTEALKKDDELDIGTNLTHRQIQISVAALAVGVLTAALAASVQVAIAVGWL